MSTLKAVVSASELDRFFPLLSTGEYLLGISQTGLTLENLDSISSSLDALTLSLDAYATAVQPEIAQFSGSHVLGFFRGANLEATMESAEQGTDENRITIRSFRPVTDAAAFTAILDKAKAALEAKKKAAPAKKAA